MLTQKQRDLLLFINDRMQKGELAPSFEEMKVALGLQSKSGVHRLITALVERGYLERLPNRARALEVRKLPDMHAAPLHGSSAPDPASSQVPLYGKIAAGTPIEAIRDEGHQIDVPSAMIGSGDHYALTVEGDSMIKAGIHNGDTILIKRCDRVENGDIAVALVDESEVTLKRYYNRDGYILLKPENDLYEDQKVTPDRVVVQGRLAGLMRLYSS